MQRIITDLCVLDVTDEGLQARRARARRHRGRGPREDRAADHRLSCALESPSAPARSATRLSRVDQLEVAGPGSSCSSTHGCRRRSRGSATTGTASSSVAVHDRRPRPPGRWSSSDHRVGRGPGRRPSRNACVASPPRPSRSPRRGRRPAPARRRASIGSAVVGQPEREVTAGRVTGHDQWSRRRSRVVEQLGQRAARPAARRRRSTGQPPPPPTRRYSGVATTNPSSARARAIGAGVRAVVLAPSRTRRGSVRRPGCRSAGAAGQVQVDDGVARARRTGHASGSRSGSMGATVVRGTRVARMTKWEYLTAPVLVHSDQADPRQLRLGRLGARADGAGDEPGEPGRLLQAAAVAMSTPEERLAELGLSVPEVAKPVAAYIPALRSGNHVFTSGQLPMRDGQLMLAGKVGGEVTQEEAVECARQCALNALAAVRAEVGELVRGQADRQGGRVRRLDPRLHRPAAGRQRRLRAARRGLRRRRPARPLGGRRHRCCRWTPRSRSS